MSFLFPLAWLWAWAVVAVVVLALLRRRERVHPVSALFLWERIPPDAVRKLQRLRAWWDPLLVVQSLAVGLMALALAQPVLWERKPTGSLALVVDASASMAAAGRVEEALARTRSWLSRSTGPWTVIAWADPPKVLVGPTKDPEAVAAGLRKFAPTLGTRAPLGQALALLPGTWGRIVVLTDDPPDAPGVEVDLLPPLDNLALAAFSVRADPDGAGYSALVRVRNDTDRFQDAQVLVHTGVGTLVQSRLVEPLGEEVFVFRLGSVGTGLRAELLPRDAFGWDNVRYLTFERGEVRLRWWGGQDRYLLAALQAALPVELAPDPPWDLTVAVRTNLPSVPGGPVLFVETSSPEAPLQEGIALQTLRGEPSSLLKGVDLTLFRAESVRPAVLAPGAEVAAWADSWPAVAVWRTQSGPRVLVALELERSNLPLLPDFPILLRNLLVWLLPWQPSPWIAVGQAVELPEGAEVLSTEGTGGRIWIPDRPGFYEVRREGRTELLAVNVPYEEVLRPTVAGAPVPLATEGGLAPRPLGVWVGILGLAVLVWEWIWAWRRGGG